MISLQFTVMAIVLAVTRKLVYIPSVCGYHRDTRHQLCPCALRPNCLLDAVDHGGLRDPAWWKTWWSLRSSGLLHPSPTDGRLLLLCDPRSSQE